MIYPRELFSPREDITRANIKAYEGRQNRIYKKCLELNPDYHKLGLREQHEIHKKAESEVK